MRNILKFFLVVLCAWTVSITGYAGDMPFYHFPGSLPDSAGVLALHQSDNKEIEFINAGGVWSFNSRQTRRIFDFSEARLSGIRQALFTARGPMVVAREGLFLLDLKQGRKEMIEQQEPENIFYDQQREILYWYANGFLTGRSEHGETKSISLDQKNIQEIIFAESELLVVAEKKVSIYNTDWELLRNIAVNSPIIHTYYAGERLLLLTEDAIWSKEKGAGLKKYASLPEINSGCILEDKTGKIWVGTQNGGLYLLDGHELVRLSAENNFPLPKVQGIYESRDLSLWFWGEGGIVCKSSPFPEVPDISAPGIILEQLFVQHHDSVSSISFTGSDSVSIGLEENGQVLIRAFAINYDGQNKAFVTYRLSKADGQWQHPAAKEFILLADLEPGSHWLELAAENEQGVKSKDPIRLQILVSRAGWPAWWTMGGASLCVALIGFVAFGGLRSARDARSKEAKEKYDRELMKLQKRSHEQMMKADGLRQVNELISTQKQELEEKNKQIIAQKYELSVTTDQIKKQKDLIERTSEKLQSSINYAMRIQTALMGDEIQMKQGLPDSFVFFKPRDQVSGDFFWFEKARNEKGNEVLIIAAVDCTGHGVPGAIVSVVGIQLLNSIVTAKGITDPGRILTELNADLLKSLKYDQTRINDGMDMSICTIDPQQQKVFYAGAKNPVYIVEDGELRIIKGDKFPIGGQNLKVQEKNYHTLEIALKGRGEQMFYLFTDGYQDQFGGPHKSKFLTKNFKNLLLEISCKSMMEQKYTLAKTITDWQADESQTDDILVLGFRL